MTKLKPYNYSNDIWQHKSGPTGFTNNWDSSQYAQQLKASAPVNSKYDEQFAALSKGDSSVDDDGAWVTLKNRSNSEEGTRQEFEALANEWKAAGYDVRVQDLDDSDGAKWADIAVRKGPGGEEVQQEPFEPVGKTDDHKTAEENYDKHFEDGNPWDTTSAVDSYQSAFDRATAAGQDMTAGDYLRQRADDKKGGVNRFTNYLTDHNTLASHESHRSAMNAIKKAGHVGLEPPALIDPGDLYNKYKGDIDSIGD